jgi:hypothetical protein
MHACDTIPARPETQELLAKILCISSWLRLIKLGCTVFPSPLDSVILSALSCLLHVLDVDASMTHLNFTAADSFTNCILGEKSPAPSISAAVPVALLRSTCDALLAALLNSSRLPFSVAYSSWKYIAL